MAKRGLLSPALGILLLAYSASAAFAQQTGSATTAAPPLMSQVAAAFAGNQVIHQVQLTGSATWYAGSIEDSGTVNLSASINGSSQMQLSLSETGTKTEIQTGMGICSWTGNDGVLHAIQSGACSRPVLWFLPALSLFSLPSQLQFGTPVHNDLGLGPVGSGESNYRHWQSTISPPNGMPSTLTSDLVKQSTTDIGLDPNTLLPAMLAYSVHPDNGAPAWIAFEVHYSDYQAVNGVQIPFHIQRYVNGSLQLDIQLSSAQVN